jgi:fimbrial chaperone protein
MPVRAPGRGAGLLLAVALGLVVGARAEGASLTVDPTRVTLTARTGSTLVTVRNEGSETIRVQLSAFAWSQSITGDVELQPTQDVVYFPRLFSLAPGEERKIRVGTTAAFGDVERTYRLFVEELPPLVRAPGENAVRMLTKFGIPVFLRPAAATAKAALTGVGLSGSRLTFTLQNAGNVHFVPEAVRVEALGSNGQSVFDRKMDGWYVLAGGSRLYELDVPAPQCGTVRSFQIEIRLRQDAVVRGQLDTPQGACGT